MLQILSGVLTLAAYIPYVSMVLKGKIQPNIVSWWIWAGVGFLLLSTYVSVGGTAGLGIASCAAFASLFVAVLSLRYGVGGVSVLDKICLIGAIVATLLWVVTASAFLPYILVLIIDFCAYVPTLRKSIADPRSESFVAWTFWMVSGAVALSATQTWSIVDTLYPSYLVVANSFVLLLLSRRFMRR